MQELSLDILARLRGCHAQHQKDDGWVVFGPTKFPHAHWLSLRPPLVLGDIGPLDYAEVCSRVEKYHAI